jgi:cyclopropane fatty-acyl-phospholipid synthase-like methyltransferase
MSWLRRFIFNSMYYRRPPWDTGISPPELLAFMQSNPPGRALDLGCGAGTNVITLAKNGWQVTGVDFARRAVTLASRKALKAGVQADLRVGDVTRLEDIPGPFDFILDMGCFHSLDSDGRKAYLINIKRLLKAQGIFLLYTFYSPPGSAAPGLTQADVKLLTDRFILDSRKNGTDYKSSRFSAWFTLRNTGEEG